MKHLTLIAILAAVVIASAAGPVAAAPNIYGTSGLIEVPDDILYPVGTVALAYHSVVNIGSSNDDLNFFTVGIGLTPKLSVSGGVVANGDSEALINAKYRLSPESRERPSITVGVVDAASEISDDPAFYIVFGKNLTAAAEEVVGGESKPLRGYLGLGTGVLEGLFVGLDWTLTPKLSGMIEYVSEGLGGSDFNGGIRYALSNELRLDAGLLDFDDFTFGISYNMVRF